jgi:hypothetical protein
MHLYTNKLSAKKLQNPTYKNFKNKTLRNKFKQVSKKIYVLKILMKEIENNIMLYVGGMN